MTARQISPTSEHSHSDSNVRKRVCKACDRCRLKKSKCDGASPCGRCRADNAICVFGERKKAQDKVYPKGYVEMLEQQQAWLVHGLQELYRRTSEGHGWPGEPLQCEPDGHPLTHDLLLRLGALSQGKGDRFEENVEAMQQALWKRSSPDRHHMQRQDSSDDSSASSGSPSPIGPPSQFAANPSRTSSKVQPPLTPPSQTPPCQYSPAVAAAAAAAAAAATTRTTAATAASPPTDHKSDSKEQQRPKRQRQQSPPPPPLLSLPRPRQSSSSSAFAPAQVQGGVVNPVALEGPQGPHQWPADDGFGSSFEVDVDDMDMDMDLMGSDYASLGFDETPMFSRPPLVPVGCMNTPSSFMDAKADYDDFNQFLNSNPAEITSA